MKRMLMSGDIIGISSMTKLVTFSNSNVDACFGSSSSPDISAASHEY